MVNDTCIPGLTDYDSLLFNLVSNEFLIEG